MFDLTRSLQAQRRAQIFGAIKIAASEIMQCQDQRKRWEAMGELRKLQAMLKRV